MGNVVKDKNYGFFLETVAWKRETEADMSSRSGGEGTLMLTMKTKWSPESLGAFNKEELQICGV